MAKAGDIHRIDYVELTVSDIARARDFYGIAFGWSFTDYGPGYCEFSDGRLTGGFAAADKAGPTKRHSGTDHDSAARSQMSPEVSG